MQKSHLFQPVTNVSTFTSSYSYSRLASLVSVSYEQMCGCHNTLKKKFLKKPSNKLLSGNLSVLHKTRVAKTYSCLDVTNVS